MSESLGHNASKKPTIVIIDIIILTLYSESILINGIDVDGTDGNGKPW